MAILSGSSDGISGFFSADAINGLQPKELDLAYAKLKAAFMPFLACCARPGALKQREVLSKMEVVLVKLLNEIEVIRARVENGGQGTKKLASDISELGASSDLLLSHLKSAKMKFSVDDYKSEIEAGILEENLSGISEPFDVKSMIEELSQSERQIASIRADGAGLEKVAMVQEKADVTDKDTLSQRINARQQQRHIKDASKLVSVSTEMPDLAKILDSKLRP